MTAGPVGTAGMALLKALPRLALCGSHLARSRASAGAVGVALVRRWAPWRATGT